MKYILTLAMLFGIAYGQSTYYMRYDSVKISRGTGGPGELIVESSTKDSTNGVMLNYGNGRTRFQRIRAISATQFTVGTDTITITGSGGGGGGGTWGSITGTISSQTDLIELLNAKQDTGLNLVYLNVGTGQSQWYETNDSIYNKRLGNSTGLSWATTSDSSLVPTIDSATWQTKAGNTALLAFKQGNITLTTTGTSGAATFVGNTLNIPQYTDAVTSVNSLTGAVTITDANLSTSDVTTNNASTSKHGFLKKLSNAVTEYMDGTGNWSVPAGGGGGAASWGSITGTLNSQTDLTQGIFTYGKNNFINIELSMGANTLFESHGLSRQNITATTALIDGTRYYVPIHVGYAATITGIRFWQGIKGVYTADNSNEVQIYTYNSATGVYTEVATTGDVPTLWSAGSANSWLDVPLTTPYSATKQTYFVGFIWNATGSPTAPTLGIYPSLINAAIHSNGYSNSGKTNGFRSAQTSMPTSESGSDITAFATQIHAALY